MGVIGEIHFGLDGNVGRLPIVDITDDASANVRMAGSNGIGAIPHAPTSANLYNLVRIQTASSSRILTPCIYMSQVTVEVSGLDGDFTQFNGTWDLGINASKSGYQKIWWERIFNDDSAQFIALAGGYYGGPGDDGSIWQWEGLCRTDTFCLKTWSTTYSVGNYPDGTTFNEDTCRYGDCSDSNSCSASQGATYNVAGYTL